MQVKIFGNSRGTYKTFIYLFIERNVGAFNEKIFLIFVFIHSDFTFFIALTIFRKQVHVKNSTPSKYHAVDFEILPISTAFIA